MCGHRGLSRIGGHIRSCRARRWGVVARCCSDSRTRGRWGRCSGCVRRGGKSSQHGEHDGWRHGKSGCSGRGCSGRSGSALSSTRHAKYSGQQHGRQGREGDRRKAVNGWAKQVAGQVAVMTHAGIGRHYPTGPTGDPSRRSQASGQARLRLAAYLHGLAAGCGRGVGKAVVCTWSAADCPRGAACAMSVGPC